MKLNSRLTTNSYFLIGFTVILVLILTLINNYYFYTHVERSTYRDAAQLESILRDEIEFCNKNIISEKRYIENIKAIVKNFAKYAYYNDTIILKHENIGILWKKPTNDWDKIVTSHIEIILPELNSENHLYYKVYSKFDSYLYFISVVRSMTFSVFDKGAKFFITTVITEEERKTFDALHKKLQRYKSIAKSFNELIGKKYKNILTDEEKKVYTNLEHELLANTISETEIESYETLKSKIEKSTLSKSDIKTALYRSRPTIGFTLFVIILAWFFRHRELQRREIEKELEKEKKNQEILKTNFGINEQDTDIDLYKAVMSNDISKLKNIEAVNSTMNIIKFNAMVDHTEDEKLIVLEVLIEKGIDLKFHDEDGMTALMYYAIGNINNEENSKIIETLIKNGINVNAQNKSGMTALMLCSVKNRPASVQILIDNGADINIKHNLTAKELAATEEIRNIISSAENHSPQNLVKLLSNFTIDKPIKYTTHTWDFGELKKEYGSFDGYMDKVKKQFDSLKDELKELSPNIYKKVYTFLLETNPSDEYSWCRKTHINIGWSNLEGLKAHCESGKNPFDFKLLNPILLNDNEISTFGEVINLFKQEIEIRSDFKNLETIFAHQKKKFGSGRNSKFNLDLSSAKLSNRQFYTDTAKFAQAIDIIFAEIKKREEFQSIELTTTELKDRSVEIKISQIDSYSSRNAYELLQRAKAAGDIADIVSTLQNLCDYSIECSYEDTNFRVNFLHSNNAKDIVELQEKPKGFTHILRFYK